MITWKLSASSIAELISTVVPTLVGGTVSVLRMRRVAGAVQTTKVPELWEGTLRRRETSADVPGRSASCTAKGPP